MRITFSTDAHLNIATAEGPKDYSFKSGETAQVPADIAALFIAAGQAAPAAAEKAAKTKGETATK